jgi:nitroimidazol reductase NimA-like FMN-containing flavoprotein (pyridoxamine 5'-phosphate oxidase superfamily)
MAPRADLAGFEILSTDECLQLLRMGCIGRVGFVGGGLPRVLPVNYAAEPDGSVVFRTATGSLLTSVAGGSATFEIDGFDERRQCGWSVCVLGVGHELEPAGKGATDRLQRVGVVTWAPGSRDRWFAITADEITGRRLPMAVKPAEYGWIAGVVS